MPRNPEVFYKLAPAKLNLYLHVLDRSNGYHQIESLAVFTRFGDRVKVSAGDAISLRIAGPFAAECGPPGENLVWRAAHALAAHATAPVGAAITLHKYLPVAGGLGGGSSDAAAVIQLLMQLWHLDIGDSALAELALGLGADVPVCLRGTPALMRGIGEILSAAPAMPPCYVLLVNPGIPVSTKAVFEKLDGRFGMTSKPLPGQISSLKLLARSLTRQRNDLQNPAIELAPQIQTVLDTLSAQKGCLLARMSGSGATCFGLFAGSGDMSTAAEAIRRSLPAYWQVQTRFA
ncbi:MAG: 4-(cytidine 5'-diphospho)-2-C-methyl-D-erythritol kinase [Alphaproteobacteria bacterium]